MSPLTFRERPAQSSPDGLLVLHHGRGTSELDLLPLADALDPAQRLHVVAPRGPLELPGTPGYHWYRVPRVGYPDPDSFAAARRSLAELHDQLFAQTGVPNERTVLGGFSMGTVMSYALGLDPDRPAPAGILAFSGFIPTVEGWEPSLTDRTATKVFIAHGRRDPVMDVGFARSARQRLEEAGLQVDYRESEAAHTIDPADLPRAQAWLATVAPPCATP
jgi:phospholipase/carboxylesterase